MTKTLTRPELQHLLGDEPRVLKSRAELDRVRQFRLIAKAIEAGASQEAVAEELGISQATVSRVLRQIRGSNGEILNESAAEVIHRRAAHEISDEQMLDQLLSIQYTSGQYDPSGGDGYVRGSWDQIHWALAEGLLSDEEYATLTRKAKIQAPSSQDAR